MLLVSLSLLMFANQNLRVNLQTRQMTNFRKSEKTPEMLKNYKLTLNANYAVML